MITTTGDMITFALRASGINGIGQTPSAEDSNTGLEFLRMLLAQWQRKRWLVPSLVETIVPSTGVLYYEMPSRQTTLHAAFARLLPAGPNPLDVNLGIIESREDYSAISLKLLSTWPAAVWLDTSWPISRAFVVPIPPAGQFELHFLFPAVLPTYATLTDPLDLPPEYEEALLWSLVVRLEMGYGAAHPDHVAAMHQALNVVQVANTQIGTLAMPLGGPRSGGTSIAARSSVGFNSGWMG